MPFMQSLLAIVLARRVNDLAIIILCIYSVLTGNRRSKVCYVQGNCWGSCSFTNRDIFSSNMVTYNSIYKSCVSCPVHYIRSKIQQFLGSLVSSSWLMIYRAHGESEFFMFGISKFTQAYKTNTSSGTCIWDTPGWE